MTTYKIVRKYRSYIVPDSYISDKVVRRGLTLEEAQAHCSDPENKSRTCSSKEGLKRTERHGEWFDCYTEEK